MSELCRILLCFILMNGQRGSIHPCACLDKQSHNNSSSIIKHTNLFTHKCTTNHFFYQAVQAYKLTGSSTPVTSEDHRTATYMKEFATCSIYPPLLKTETINVHEQHSCEGFFGITIICLTAALRRVSLMKEVLEM